MFSRAPVLILAIVLAAWNVTMADNAIPIAVRDSSDCRILFFAHESPLRAGIVNISVMLLDAASGQPLQGWDVTGNVHALRVSDDAGEAWVPACCRIDGGDDTGSGIPLQFARSRNGNLFAKEAAVVLARPGTWSLESDFLLRNGTRHSAEIELEVTAPRPPLVQYWPWFAFLPVAVCGFALTRRK